MTRVLLRSVIVNTTSYGPNLKVYEINDAELFHSLMVAAKRSNEHGAYVDVQKPEEYQYARLFVLNSGAAVFAVRRDGTLISLVKNRELARSEGLGRVNRELILTALSAGCRKVDCFDGFLTRLYRHFGFQSVCRLKFSLELAPNDWNYVRDGQPDVVFLLHSYESVSVVANKHDHGLYQISGRDESSILYSSDYYSALQQLNRVQARRERELRDHSRFVFFE